MTFDDLRGGPGNDTVLAKDGEADEISYGPGTDVVYFDQSLDTLSSDCSD
jgi:hypothetical protein